MELSRNILHRFHWKASPYQLAALRIACGLQILYAVNSGIFDLLLAVNARQNKVATIFPELLDRLTADHLVHPFVIICTVGAVLLTIGLFTRIILPMLTVAFVVLYGFYYLGANAPAQWLYLWFPLVVFCFADTQAVWSVDALIAKRRQRSSPTNDIRFRWPLELCVLWFCYIYFAAGLAKLFPLFKGFSWFNGQTSKEIIYYRYLDSPFHYVFGEPFFNYAEAGVFFSVITLMALALELYAIVLVFTDKRHMLVLCSFLFMHLFLYMTGVAGFTQTALILGISLMPQHWFEKLGALLTARSAG